MTRFSDDTGQQFALSPLWGNVPPRRGQRYLMEALAIVAAVSILLAFFQVVQGSVRHGEELRLTMAARSAATYHCNSQSSTGAADSCLRQLNAPLIAAQVKTVLLVPSAGAIK